MKESNFPRLALEAGHRISGSPKSMVRLARLELAASGFVDRRSDPDELQPQTLVDGQTSFCDDSWHSELHISQSPEALLATLFYESYGLRCPAFFR